MSYSSAASYKDRRSSGGDWTTNASKRFFVTLSSESCFERELQENGERYNLPKENLIRSSEWLDMNADGIRAKPGALSRIDRKSKLTLIAHGDSESVQFAGNRVFDTKGRNGPRRPDFEHDVGPERLAIILSRASLKDVGVSKIDACEVGKANFIDCHLRAAHFEGIGIGYCSASKVDVTQNSPFEAPSFLPELLLRPGLLSRQSVKVGPFELPAHWGLKVRRGNIRVEFEKPTRYQPTVKSAFD